MDDNKPEAVEEVKSRDLASMERDNVPKKTWFFERGDGMIFPCEEKEAWDILYNTSTWKRRDFKMVGVSDGKTYHKMVKDAKVIAKKLEPEIERLRKEIARFAQAEDKLMFDEVIDMEDTADPVNAANIAKVRRIKNILEKQRADLAKKETEFRKVTSGIVKRAIDAELKVARGHFERPGAVNIITPNAGEDERQRILNTMGGRR